MSAKLALPNQYALLRRPYGPWAGSNRIYGRVRMESQPAAKAVHLLEYPSMVWIKSAQADSDGNYTFENIRAGTYLVVAFDLDTNYHPDIARVQSEPM